MPPSGTRTGVLKACWTMTTAYVFGDGYSALGGPTRPNRSNCGSLTTS